MRRNLPPLHALRVFEVAGRTENFSKAAEELCITQSAVSKQIRLLEENLSAKLFSRDSGVIKLTLKGRQIFEAVACALDSLESATQTFYSHKYQESLTVNITPSMNTFWMFEHVNSFSQLLPNITLYIDSDAGEIDWVKGKTDIAIRVMPRSGLHPNSELLFSETLVLVAAPSILNKQAIIKVDDILQHQLILNSSRMNLWEDFFKKFDLDEFLPDVRLVCQYTHMTMNAALQGLGLALVPKLLCEDFLNTGQLVNPLGLEIDSGRGYYFQTPSYKRNERKIRLFREWITSQLAKESAASKRVILSN